jgi:hypothetical protein
MSQMRPAGDTALASTITAPAPPTARLPRCTKCQSVARPSTHEYWHIGDITIRLRSVTPRISISENKWATLIIPYAGTARSAQSQRRAGFMD